MIAALSSTSALSSAHVFTSVKQSSNASRGALQVGFPCLRTYAKSHMALRRGMRVAAAENDGQGAERPNRRTTCAWLFCPGRVFSLRPSRAADAHQREMIEYERNFVREIPCARACCRPLPTQPLPTSILTMLHHTTALSPL